MKQLKHILEDLLDTGFDIETGGLLSNEFVKLTSLVCCSDSSASSWGRKVLSDVKKLKKLISEYGQHQQIKTYNDLKGRCFMKYNSYRDISGVDHYFNIYSFYDRMELSSYGDRFFLNVKEWKWNNPPVFSSTFSSNIYYINHKMQTNPTELSIISSDNLKMLLKENDEVCEISKDDFDNIIKYLSKLKFNASTT